MNFPYPPKPLNADRVSIAPSDQFKKEVAGVVATIILFFVVYVALVIGAVALAIGCFYLGGMLIIAMPKLITIVAGLGMMAVGVSLVFFLIKFIFAKRISDNPQRVEITEAEQPHLFAFIRELSRETQTPFPKKIFLSPQVNACVFYNSSFWSMFFPVRKNLEIGLGLVNAINMGEFKAVIAHEFGHFSQRSMKLGSFTYNVNQVIHNMLFENNSYSNFLTAWGSLDGLLSIFASITVGIARGIQWILRQVYEVVNKKYMSLSREMEFHADAVAASVAGGNNLVTAFHRIELADASYQFTINKVNEALSNKKASRNLFADQFTILQQTARNNGLPFSHDLPVITSAFTASRHTSRINYKDQWASHPTNEDRTARLEQLGLEVGVSETRAWEIFEAPELLQERLTQHLYTVAQVEMKEVTFYDNTEFKREHEANEALWELPAAYKDFFEGHYPDPALLTETGNNQPVSWSVIDTPAHRQLKDRLKRTSTDLELLEAIASKQTAIKSFDFDGQKYLDQDAAALASQLRTEVDTLRKEQEGLDRLLLTWLVQENATGLSAYQQWKERNVGFEAVGSKALEKLHILYAAQGMSITDAEQHIADLKQVHEPALRKIWTQLIDQHLLSQNEQLQAAIKAFMDKQYVYLLDGQLRGEELGNLYQLIIDTGNWLLLQQFGALKQWILPTVPVLSHAAVMDNHSA